MAIANLDESTPSTECNKNHAGAEWMCIFLQNAYPFIRGKFMIINSEYDAWAIPNLMKIPCLK